jgi:hypothetical protein
MDEKAEEFEKAVYNAKKTMRFKNNGETGTDLITIISEKMEIKHENRIAGR